MSPTHIELSFGRAAERYVRHAAVQRELAGWLAEWAPSVRKGRALELGAGPGVFTEFVLPWQGEYLATDLSAAMCAAGRRRFPTVTWRKAAAEQPPSGSWEWIFTSSMLQWMEDPVAVLAACRRALAPRGRLLAGLFVAPTLREWSDIIRPGADAIPLSWRSAEDWRAAAEQAGLRVLRCESQSRTFEYPSARDLLRSLHATGAAPTRRLPPTVLRRALKRYDEHFKVEAASRRFRGGGDAASTIIAVRSTWTFCRIEASN